jgi:hypothetical protein
MITLNRQRPVESFYVYLFCFVEDRKQLIIITAETEGSINKKKYKNNNNNATTEIDSK